MVYRRRGNCAGGCNATATGYDPVLGDESLRQGPQMQLASHGMSKVSIEHLNELEKVANDFETTSREQSCLYLAPDLLAVVIFGTVMIATTTARVMRTMGKMK